MNEAKPHVTRNIFMITNCYYAGTDGPKIKVRVAINLCGRFLWHHKGRILYLFTDELSVTKLLKLAINVYILLPVTLLSLCVARWCDLEEKQDCLCIILRHLVISGRVILCVFELKFH